MVKINTIAASQETDQITPEFLNQEMIFLSGKYAGTCYAADGYETIKTQPAEKAVKRASSTAANGHHSVFQHSMVTMEIQCPKIIAMLLNSIGVSNTSEKSARYTRMQPETERECELYEKWRVILEEQIQETYGDRFSEKERNKLAYENARYLLSVFCPTSMVYSLPFRNIFYVRGWAEQMRENLRTLTGSFNERLAEELQSLAESLSSVVDHSAIIQDNKNEYFRFMPVQATGQFDDDNIEFFGDVYTAKFYASFAQVAQEQRHRTLRVKINFSGSEPGEYGYYVPEILQREELRRQWLEDISSLGEQYPQGMLVSVTEQGLFEDFVMKCKERMCGRAQLEIMRITQQLVEQFVRDRQNLSQANQKRLDAILENGKPCARCGYADFTCVEGCTWGKTEACSRKI
ncbi:MAG: FAD-dependent thymidylate synthase [Lachnospiraceae bacterium]|nr:FAD-dependent thymidylate synthase [Lachnospiraceae bacterium]